MKDMANIRLEYQETKLDDNRVGEDPILFFRQWFEEAVTANVLEPNAMVLGTASKDGFPSTRIVLLKGLEEGEFIFFTNYLSKKSRHIRENPFVSLNFFWKEIHRQINIEGEIQKVTLEKSQEYFKTRPKGSQISAFVSRQSFELESQEFLDKKFARAKDFFMEKDVPCPDNWGGYSVSPIRIEFWQGRANRLHDRILFCKNPNLTWKKSRLYP